MLRQANNIVNRLKEKITEKIAEKINPIHGLDANNGKDCNPIFTENKIILGNTSRACLGGGMLEEKTIQRFTPYSLLDQMIYAVVHAEQKNWIVTLPGNRQQRTRDFEKKIFDKKYVLERHTFGTSLKVGDPSNTGYYKQAWYIGNKHTYEQDVKNARIKGPEAYYIPKEILRHCIKIVKAICRTLGLFYSHKLDYSQTIAKINQCIYAINHKKKLFNKYAIHWIECAARSFFKIGNLNHIRGGCFGRGSGRRPTKITEKQKRPYTFHKTMCSKEGRRLISTEVIAASRMLGIKCTDRILKNCHIEIRKYYWSDRYLKNNDLKPGTKPLAIISHCIKMLSYDLLLIAKHSRVHNHVHGPVSNENKTGHYYSPKRGITNKIDISKFQNHRPPPKSFKKDLKRGANWNIEDKPKAFRQETGGFIDINEIITKNINIEPDVKEKEIPRVAEDAPNTDIEGPTGSLEVGEVVNPPPTCFEAVEAPVSEIDPAPVRRRPMTTAEKLRAMGLSDDCPKDDFKYNGHII